MKGPLYRTLAASLRDRIAAGDYPAGSALPTEHELCALYGVSRHTARDALRLLQDAGLIERRRGAGTIVLRTAPDERFVQSLDGLGGLLQYARDARLSEMLLSSEPSDDPSLCVLALDTSARWMRITGVRRADAEAQPVAITTIHIRADLCPNADTLASLDGALNEWIETAHGVRAVQVAQVITAVALDGHSAPILGCDVGAPALRTVRKYLDADRSVFQASVSLHPGDRFSYEMVLKRAD